MEFKREILGTWVEQDVDDSRRKEAMEKARQQQMKKSIAHEKSFIKSNDSDMIQKRMGSDLFKGGME